MSKKDVEIKTSQKKASGKSTKTNQYEKIISKWPEWKQSSIGYEMTKKPKY